MNLLKEHNGGQLLPWFFNDKQPEGLPTVCPSDQNVSVCLTYAFAVEIPEGLFQRLSARCHRHSNSTRHWLNGVHVSYGGIAILLQCIEERATITLVAVTFDSLKACARLWHVVCRLMGDIENVIKQAPGTARVVQRYLCTSQEACQSVLQVGARQVKVQLHEDYPAFQMNEEDPIAGTLENHKNAVLGAQEFVKMPLKSIFSPKNGWEVTPRQVSDTALLIHKEAVSQLRVVLNVHKSDILGSTDALAVINKWRESSSHGCVSVLRDALHKVGLQRIDESVFGDIRDLTLTRPEAGATATASGMLNSEGRNSKNSGEKISCQLWYPFSNYACLIECQHGSRKIRAVLKCGASRWFEIGIELGFNPDQITCCSYNKPESSSKLLAITYMKIAEVGMEETEESLLMACKRISPPIFGAVRDELQYQTDDGANMTVKG